MNHRAIGFVLFDIQLVSSRYTTTNTESLEIARSSRKQNNKRIRWREIFFFKFTFYIFNKT